MATHGTTQMVMAIGQHAAPKKEMAIGQDGATKVEPAIRGFGGANRGAHRGLGRTSTTASREEVTRQMETALGHHDVRSFAKGRVHAPATK